MTDLPSRCWLPVEYIHAGPTHAPGLAAGGGAPSTGPGRTLSVGDAIIGVTAHDGEPSS